MYRAIPEVNRICSLNDRARQYRLHKEALRRIKKTNSTKSQASLAAHPLQNRTLRGKYQKEEQSRITHENQKMVNAMMYRSPIIDRVELYQHEVEHEQNVKRLTTKNANYGNVIEQKRPRKTYQETKPVRETKQSDAFYPTAPPPDSTIEGSTDADQLDAEHQTANGKTIHDLEEIIDDKGQLEQQHEDMSNALLS